MRGMKIPPRQDFALKMQEGLMHEGGGAYLRDTTVVVSICYDVIVVWM